MSIDFSSCSRVFRRSVLSIVAVLAALIWPFVDCAVSADVVTAQFGGNTSFNYEIIHMPDLDQRRGPGSGVLSLPGDGSMYCVPTSTTNMMMYIANHGFPAVLPGPGNWQDQGMYNAATLNIFVMGLLMNTDAANGTGGNDWLNGGIDWLNQNSEGSKFTVKHEYFTGLLGPNLNSISQDACNGNLVSIAYGFYESLGTHEGLPYYKRVGGHIVTVAKTYRNGNDQTLWVRDPADDTMLTTQSTFGNREFDVEGKVVYVKDGNGNAVLRAFSALNFSDDGNKRFIDEAFLIRPKAGYSFKNIGGVWKITQILTAQIVGSSLPPAEVEIIAEGDVNDGIMNSNGTKFYSINVAPGAAGITKKIRCLDMLTSESVVLTTIPNAIQMALGKNDEVYIITPTQLMCVDTTQSPPPIQTVTLPFTGAALTYDRALGEVDVLSVLSRRLMRYRNLIDPPIIKVIPETIPLSGLARLAVDPKKGLYWFLTQATPTLHGWGMDAAGNNLFDSLTIPGMTPTSMDFDDAGAIEVCDGSVLKEFQKDSRGVWKLIDPCWFPGANVGPIFHVVKSQSNFDPVQHSGPGYVNVDPDDMTPGKLVLDCDEDVSRNGIVDVDDLLDVINDWGDCDKGPCAADVTGNRTVDVDDLLRVINGWGMCP